MDHRLKYKIKTSKTSGRKPKRTPLRTWNWQRVFRTTTTKKTTTTIGGQKQNKTKQLEVINTKNICLSKDSLQKLIR